MRQRRRRTLRGPVSREINLHRYWRRFYGPGSHFYTPPTYLTLGQWRRVSDWIDSHE